MVSSVTPKDLYADSVFSENFGNAKARRASPPINSFISYTMLSWSSLRGSSLSTRLKFCGKKNASFQEQPEGLAFSLSLCMHLQVNQVFRFKFSGWRSHLVLHDNIVIKIEAQSQPKLFNWNIMHTLKVAVSRKHTNVIFRMKNLAAERWGW